MTKPAVDLETAAKHLDRILGFFPRVESKASFLFALNSALLGTLAINVQRSDFALWYHLIFIIVAAALIATSFFFVYRCIFPSLKGGHSSLLYFREINKLREAEYITAMKNASTDDLVDDFISQAWRNAEILGKKFDHVKVAFILTGLGLIPWAMFLVLAGLNHPQLPVIK
jgi:hypothetical protein